MLEDDTTKEMTASEMGGMLDEPPDQSASFKAPQAIDRQPEFNKRLLQTDTRVVEGDVHVHMRGFRNIRGVIPEKMMAP